MAVTTEFFGPYFSSIISDEKFLHAAFDKAVRQKKCRLKVRDQYIHDLVTQHELGCTEGNGYMSIFRPRVNHYDNPDWYADKAISELYKQQRTNLFHTICEHPYRSVESIKPEWLKYSFETFLIPSTMDLVCIDKEIKIVIHNHGPKNNYRDLAFYCRQDQMLLVAGWITKYL